MAAQSGLDAIRPASSEPQGALKVAAPAFVTQSALMDTFADFAKAYPRVQLDLDFSDHRRDLIKEGFDVAVRAGQLESSELRARSIGVTQRRLVASPAYVASKDLPLHPRDLESWDWVRFALRSEQIHFTSPDGETLSVQGSSHVVVDSASALQALVVRGLGLSVLPEDLAAHGCERGELVHVLPGWSLRPLGLYVVWPQQARRANLTMIFIRFLADRGGRRGSDDPA
ncbi:MAG: substrate binding domain-containing protein [Myxococcota bacterium]